MTALASIPASLPKMPLVIGLGRGSTLAPIHRALGGAVSLRAFALPRVPQLINIKPAFFQPAITDFAAGRPASAVFDEAILNNAAAISGQSLPNATLWIGLISLVGIGSGIAILIISLVLFSTMLALLGVSIFTAGVGVFSRVVRVAERARASTK